MQEDIMDSRHEWLRPFLAVRTDAVEVSLPRRTQITIPYKSQFDPRLLPANPYEFPVERNVARVMEFVKFRIHHPNGPWDRPCGDQFFDYLKLVGENCWLVPDFVETMLFFEATHETGVISPCGGRVLFDGVRPELQCVELTEKGPQVRELGQSDEAAPVPSVRCRYPHRPI